MNAADRDLAERDQLWRRYRAIRRQALQRTYDTHPQGPELQAFARQVRRYGAADATAMRAYVREQARSWLATAEPEIRAAALMLVDDRIIEIRVQIGLAPFDDPLPASMGGDDTHNVFQDVKRELE